MQKRFFFFNFVDSNQEMRKRIQIVSLVMAFVFIGCSKANTDTTIPIKHYDEEIPREVQEGIIRIKLESYSEELLQDLRASYLVQRTFPPAGKFEPRHCKAGLDLWYDLIIDPEISLTKATKAISSFSGISEVEYVYRPKRCSFNDPYLPLQWYLNSINVPKAWEISTGSSDVIVAINDEAPQYNHEDLASSMWINEAEMNGEPGVDDDDNGYIDDIYGYNFTSLDGLNPVGELKPFNHGTHISGIIAATSNNNKGIAGIAGGNGNSNTGVRLMTTQMMVEEDINAFIAQSIVYAADNGAVLVNCSWTLGISGPISNSLQDAILYFNDYAGYDWDDNQVGPMAGGLAIFAAGNGNVETSNPAKLPSVFAVAALDANKEKAYYSNFGSWVDICAPGGDSFSNKGIFSAFTNSYDYLQGTSVAAPQVTGVAALIISKYGGQGFTRNDLINILKESADASIYSKNHAYSGRLGAGLVDAAKALSYAKGRPGKVQGLSANITANAIHLNWDEYETGESPFSYNIYYSENEFSASDLASVSKRETNSTLSFVLDNLELGNTYYIRVEAVGVNGEKSELSDMITCHTGQNHPPILIPLTETDFTMKSHETKTMKFKMYDEDEHKLTYGIYSAEFKSIVEGLTFHISNDTVLFNINALNLKDDRSYKAYFQVSDDFDTVSHPINFTVLKNNAPKSVDEIPGVIISELDEKIKLDISQFFFDPDEEHLNYKVEFLEKHDDKLSFYLTAQGALSIISKKYGYSHLKLTATDARGSSVSAELPILVRDEKYKVDLYPNPVVDYLYIRTAKPEKHKVTIKNRVGATMYQSNGEVEIGPFSPLKVYFEDVPIGVYYITLSGHKGQVFSVVKK